LEYNAIYCRRKGIFYDILDVQNILDKLEANIAEKLDEAVDNLKN